MERISDESERASHHEALFTANAEAVARGANAPQQVQNADGSWPHPDCVDCGEPIPLARLKLHRIRCVHCQEFLEGSKKR